MKYEGSCHCEAIKFLVEAPEELEVDECNCSICSKVGFLHLIVPQSKFEMIAGAEYLTHYRFNSKIADHTFCRVCGVKPFYVPRSNPDGISVNARCLQTEPKAMRIVPFDGQNWEQNAADLAHKSFE